MTDTGGLRHCPAPDCVMHAPTYREEIDLEPAALCEGARRRCGSTPRAWTATARPDP